MKAVISKKGPVLLGVLLRVSEILLRLTRAISRKIIALFVKFENKLAQVQEPKVKV